MPTPSPIFLSRDAALCSLEVFPAPEAAKAVFVAPLLADAGDTAELRDGEFVPLAGDVDIEFGVVVAEEAVVFVTSPFFNTLNIGLLYTHPLQV